jgi:hypothetical protein
VVTINKIHQIKTRFGFEFPTFSVRQKIITINDVNHCATGRNALLGFTKFDCLAHNSVTTIMLKISSLAKKPKKI